MKLVLLHQVFDHWDQPEVRRYFEAFVSAKRMGFKYAHGDKALPMNSYDFAGTLFLFCEEDSEGSIHPASVFKLSTTRHCSRKNLGFEALSLTGAVNPKTHHEALLAELDAAKQKGEVCAYLSSWTVVPKARISRESKALLRALGPGAAVNYCRDRGIHQTFSGGSVTYRVHELQRESGFVPLKKDGEELAPFEVPFLDGERCLMMSAKEFVGTWAKNADQIKSIWENRLELGVDPVRVLEREEFPAAA